MSLRSILSAKMDGIYGVLPWGTQAAWARELNVSRQRIQQILDTNGPYKIAPRGRVSRHCRICGRPLSNPYVEPRADWPTARMCKRCIHKTRGPVVVRCGVCGRRIKREHRFATPKHGKCFCNPKHRAIYLAAHHLTGWQPGQSGNPAYRRNAI